MNLSSILVYSSPQYLEDVKLALNSIPGVEVPYTCRDTGRMVVIQEMPNGASEVESLKFIKTLPNILAAELVYHYQEQEQNFNHATPNEMEVMS